ncbi:MAG: anion permease [Rhodospirillales bacterium]|nr:anion permease [Rhodospirillales bacterium]
MIHEELVLDTPMLASAIVLFITFVGIFTEHLHHIHRTKVAMLGAGLMVVVGQFYGFYDPEGALHAIDWNVVFLLGAMMTVVSIMIPTGGFQAVAYRIAKFSKGRLFLLLFMMGLSISVISMFLANVTVVAIFGPLIVLISQALKVNPVPHLMAAALLSNVGGIATLVGDPPNLMIGSAADINFSNFFIRMAGIVVVAWVVSLFAIRVLFNKKLTAKPEKTEFTNGKLLKDKKIWYASILVMITMIFMFIFQTALGWDAWVVSAFGLTVLLALTYKANPDSYFADIELSLLVFFIGLFVIVGGVEHSHFLEWVGQFIKPLVENDIVMACIILMWVSAILSAAIDNIPFTAAMIPIILGMEAEGIDVMPLWWALAVGVGLGANGTHLGASPNLYVMALSERLAEKENKPSLAITPGLWFRKGTPTMIVALIVSTFIFWGFFNFYASPIHDTEQRMAALNGTLEEIPVDAAEHIISAQH